MNALDRIIRDERRQKYKYFKRLIKARDMASKHIKFNIRMSQLDKFVRDENLDIQGYYIGNLAKLIMDYQNRIINGRLRPPKPPVLRK